MKNPKELLKEECPDFNLNPETFKHDNTAYQEIASSSNIEADQLVGIGPFSRVSS